MSSGLVSRAAVGSWPSRTRAVRTLDASSVEPIDRH